MLGLAIGPQGSQRLYSFVEPVSEVVPGGTAP
jgi:hypothetical protein